MRGHTYADLALRYEVDLCDGVCDRPGHRRGWVGPMGVVHFDPARAVTRAGLRRFLMLVNEAYRVSTDVPPTPLWRRRPALEKRAIQLYNASVFATKTALYDLGIRLPAYLSRQDKARVRAMLSGAPTELRRSKVGRWAGLR